MYSMFLKVLVVLLAILAAVSCADNATTTTAAATSSTTEASPAHSSERPSFLTTLGESLFAIPFGIVEAIKYGAEACEDFWGSLIG